MTSSAAREKCFRLIEKLIDRAFERVVFDDESELLRLINLLEHDGKFQRVLIDKILELCSQVRNVNLSELNRLLLIVYDPIADWTDFYRSLGVEPDFSNLWIPSKPYGLDRLLIRAKGTSASWLYDRASKLFLCKKWPESILEGIISNRTADKESYAVWARSCVQADEKLKDFSARMLRERLVPGITIEERILFEIKYFLETGSHLDTAVWTLCAGSRDVDGDVPIVGWCSGGVNRFTETWTGGYLYIGTADFNGHSDDFRSREVFAG